MRQHGSQSSLMGVTPGLVSAQQRGPLVAAFFDIGGTLGLVENGTLTLFSNTRAVVEGLRALGLKLGIITNVPPDWDQARVVDLIEQAGIIGCFEKKGIITSTEAKASKPDRKIFEFAAVKLGVPMNESLFIGEAENEVAGAIAAGMCGILKAIPPNA
jgi:FMN phosphatase YigB (HAD superfamily)